MSATATQPDTAPDTSSPRRESGLMGLVKHPALPAFVGVIAVWIAAWAEAGHGFWGTFSVGATVAGYLVIVGIGQLFVITAGNGGIDLSVPYVMTLAGYISSEVMNGKNGLMVPGIIVALAIGAAAGLINAVLIEFVGMPPLVGTLAVGFTIQSVILVHSSSSSGRPSPGLSHFVDGKWGGVPIFAIFAVLLTIVFGYLLKRGTFGRRIEAVGQSPTAARLAGINPKVLRGSAYVLAGTLAGITGLLLASHNGGPSLDMGTPYQLESIAVVVLGGSLIAGGRSNVAGVWAGAVLLTLLITLVNVAHISSGMQDVVEGALIVLVLALSRNPQGRRS